MRPVPAEFLPPSEHLAERIYALPDVRYPHKLNLAEFLLDRNVAQRPKKPALLYRDQRITYAELRARVNQLANALRSLGVGAGDRVMLRAPNTPTYIVANFACWRIGAIPVLVNHLLRAEEVAFRANDSAAKVAIVAAEVYEDVRKARPDFETVEQVIVFGDRVEGCLSYESLVAGQSVEAETAPTTGADFGRLIYTSGTTGRSKGVIGSISDLLAATDTHGRYSLQLRESDVIGGHPYFTFAFGSVNFTLHAWRFGTTVSIIDRFYPEVMLQTVQDHRISVLCCVPTAFRMMLGVAGADQRFDTSSLRLCQSAGEWLPGATYHEWKERFGVDILDSLGSGELNYWLTTAPGIARDKVGSTGRPVHGIEAKIVDENGSEVPRGTEGELIIRGPFRQVYWRRPEVQAKATCNGWNRTGLLYLEDQDGYFWYKSRLDDMIVTSGHKVPGGEVEAAINEHPAVMESAAVPTPDEQRGNVVKCFVVLKEPYRPSTELIAELQQFVKDRIEPYKYPRVIEFAKADELPRTSTGKIQRSVLAQMERDGCPR